MRKRKIVHFVDTETTGLPEDTGAAVIEIAVVTIAVEPDGEWGILHELGSLVRPPEDLTDEHMKTMEEINHIRLRDAWLAPKPQEVREQIRAILNSFRGWGDQLVTAWNLPFDRHMIRRTFMALNEFEHVREEHPSKLVLLQSKYGWPEHLPMPGDATPWGECAMRAWARAMAKGGANLVLDAWTGELGPKPARLASAAAQMGVEFLGPAHRALTDARVGAEIYAKTLTGDIREWVEARRLRHTEKAVAGIPTNAFEAMNSALCLLVEGPEVMTGREVREAAIKALQEGLRVAPEKGRKGDNEEEGDPMKIRTPDGHISNCLLYHEGIEVHPKFGPCPICKGKCPDRKDYIRKGILNG